MLHIYTKVNAKFKMIPLPGCQDELERLEGQGFMGGFLRKPINMFQPPKGLV